MHDLEQSEELLNTEYTYLHCVFLDIRAPQNSSSPFGTIQYYNNKSKTPGTKVPRILGGIHYYRRIYTFGDLNTQGLVFVIIDKTNDDENRHWREGKQNISIGDTLLIREPNNIKNYISEGIPIIETMLPFKFLKKHAKTDKNIEVHKSITIQHFFYTKTLLIFSLIKQHLVNQVATIFYVIGKDNTKKIIIVVASQLEPEMQAQLTQLISISFLHHQDLNHLRVCNIFVLTGLLCCFSANLYQLH